MITPLQSIAGTLRMFLLDKEAAQKQKLDHGSLGRVRPVRTKYALLSDDEGDGRFGSLLRQQERQLGHSAVTCLEWATLSSPSALPKDPEGMWFFQADSTT